MYVVSCVCYVAQELQIEGALMSDTNMYQCSTMTRSYIQPPQFSQIITDTYMSVLVSCQVTIVCRYFIIVHFNSMFTLVYWSNTNIQ
jgi:hypothetical protein